AVYEMDLEFNQDGSDILIKNIRMIEGKEYHIFQLGKFGFTSDNRLKAAYNLDRLVLDPSEAQKSKFAPPKDSSLYRAGISILAFGGVLQPNYLGAVTYPENLVMNTPSTNEQWGYTAGIKFFFPAGKKGNFKFTLGLGYERNEYNLSYGEMRFNYNLDCFGNPLTDFEGTVYDEKRVAVSSYKESGHLGFIQPEFGLLYHINFGKKMKLTLFGNVGFSYLTSSSFKSEAVVSYQGVKDGLVIDVEQLGFYQDHQVNSSGEISNAISFYKAGYGGSLDFRIGKRQWLALAFEMRQGLSPVLDTGYEFCPFLDADVSDNFLSTFTNIESKREYEAMGVSVSYRYQFPKK
ncbi:MAG: hypothetical protein N4A46_00525, partial [Schleiferiaceae bacterium]|nr:hypothetical protein [Schleiferiaceae bacterium]